MIITNLRLTSNKNKVVSFSGIMFGYSKLINASGNLKNILILKVTKGQISNGTISKILVMGNTIYVDSFMKYFDCVTILYRLLSTIYQLHTLYFVNSNEVNNMLKSK